METMHNAIYDKLNMTFNRMKLKSYEETLAAVQSITLRDWSDDQLLRASQELRQKAQSGCPLRDVLLEAATFVNEAAMRMLGYRMYNAQLLAGFAMCDGHLSEMQTGEGKTLSAVLPAYWHALQGRGSHVFTFNDYLARRDAAWMGPIYQRLGLTVACIQEECTAEERRAAYAADVTYVTARQACFDYLRDSLVYDANQRVQRPLAYVLVDEADSILIDEARVPLVIAGDTGESNLDFSQVLPIVAQLTPGVDYDTDDHKRNVYLTEVGAEKVEARLDCGNLYDLENHELLTRLNCMLHAEALIRKGIHYIVRDGAIQLIDEFTGRIADRRHWPDGLQAAVEAREGLQPRSTGKILGSITLQHFLSLYDQLCGMTATAWSSMQEFKETYNLDVIVIPPKKSCVRIDYPPAIYVDRASKSRAVVQEILSVHPTGRPILIGTASVEESGRLAAELTDHGVACHVLNAEQDQQEAEIIARAGEWGAVTVSTNMAGRGVDILLGGGEPTAYHQVAALGGLYVIGTHLHESVRVDNQLRGRAGRQGDPGGSKFFLSLEDDLLETFGIQKVLPDEYRHWHKDAPLEGTKIHQLVLHIQRVIEGQNYEIHKTLNKYADLIEAQRKLLFRRRTAILTNQEAPGLLKSRDTAWYEALCLAFGQKHVEEAEKYITLVQIDRHWADHLAYAADLRESIHLESIGKNNPLDAFHQQLIQAYEQMNENIDASVLHVLHQLDLTERIIRFEFEEMRVPSATWTYIINDAFFPNRVSLM